MLKLKICLFLEGIFFFGLAAILFYTGGLQNPIYLISMPFEYIGKVLRWFSLSSSVGNIIANLLYIMLSLLPLIYMVQKHLNARLVKTDILLPILSIFLFYMLYEFVNPDLMIQRIQLFDKEISISMAKISFSITFYALCVGYLILKMASSLMTETTEDKSGFLCKGLEKILVAAVALYTFGLGFIMPFDMFQGFSKYVSEDRTSINALFIVLSFLLQSLPVIFTIMTLISGIKLVNEMIINHMKDEEIEAAKKMGTISKRAVYVTVICNIALNLMQFLFSSQLNDTSYNLAISLFPLIIAFMAMILSGFFKAVKELNEDNEMII